ncbi:hypothetical protein TYRP_006716 [Tyrophagus putrescentiae]|nr:hypothetical protein TYRP_006716 [Tyrophagus putrescentiae]
MTEAEKAPYTAASAVAKARYEEHMVAYKAQQLALAAPKKPLTSYMTFAVAERPKVLQEMQKTTGTGGGRRAGSKVGVVEVATELGRRWAALPTAVKKAYEMTAARARKEYAAALAEQEAAEEEEEDEEGEEGDEDSGGGGSGQEKDTENEGETDDDSTAATAAADDDDESASEFVESTVEESCNENDENEDYEEEDAGQEKEEDVLAYCSRFFRRRRRRGSFSPSYSYSSGESFDSFDGDEFEEEEEEGGKMKTGHVFTTILTSSFFHLEGVRIAADATAEGKLLPGGRVEDVQWTALLTLQRHTARPHRTLRIVLQHDQPLKVLVAGVAEVRAAEAEVHRHRAAEAALVLQVVGAVLRADLRLGDVGAAAADQLLRVEVVGVAVEQLGVAARLPAKQKRPHPHKTAHPAR